MKAPDIAAFTRELLGDPKSPPAEGPAPKPLVKICGTRTPDVSPPSSGHHTGCGNIRNHSYTLPQRPAKRSPVVISSFPFLTLPQPDICSDFSLGSESRNQSRRRFYRYDTCPWEDKIRR